MRDLSDDNQAADESLPRKRLATGAGSGSPLRDSSPPVSPGQSKARHFGQFDSTSDTDNIPRNMLDIPDRPQIGKRQLWQEGQAPLTKASFNDPSNFASIAAQKARAQHHHQRPRKPYPPPPSFQSPRPVPQNNPVPSIGQTSGQLPSTLENFDLVLQPETRPISQEQLVTEVKGIYAGLVMVEAKCIEVDNKQATLAQADPGAQPKLNNEQWQALIALHRTLLHEHHDFFLASQHPSASAALRRLASKYAMPARMWRHGIHSFLELLRHRLPASLDHMLAFIYLAYSMMALLYETVPAFEDTWIECLGDLGRYRMAIEDDDIRDREVWTGVARHWYSKASDKAPTTGRLYHHLAILARPNALQQLFYYAKSLCVAIPLTTPRESILNLFDPVLDTDNYHGQYRLPPVNTSFVKAHGLLFTNKNMDRFESTIEELFSLLDSQTGRVTRKFVEQGYHIAVANSVAMLGFASKDNVFMKAMSGVDVDMKFSPAGDTSASLSNPTAFGRSLYATQNDLQCLEQELKTREVGLIQLPRSGTLASTLRLLQRFKSVFRASVIFGHLSLVKATSTETVQSTSAQVLRPTALATTLGVCFLSMRAAKRYWNIDLLLAANIVTPVACMYVATDQGFSDHELFVLWLYGVGLDFMWLKDKILKYSKSAGIIALLLPLIGILSASEFVHKVPGLATRFNDQVLPIAILSLPTTVLWSLTWVAIGRTGFAEDLENGEYNPQIFGFIKYIFDTFVLSMVDQLTRSATAYFLGQRVPNLGGGNFRQPVHDIEADPRDFYQRNEPLQDPVESNPYRPQEEERCSGQWSPNHY
jgi:hypothetical protein